MQRRGFMKNSKRIITLILALVMALSTMSFSALASNFSDITNEKVAEAVAKLVANGIITGYEDGTFRPDNQITRARIKVTILFKFFIKSLLCIGCRVVPHASLKMCILHNYILH